MLLNTFGFLTIISLTFNAIFCVDSTVILYWSGSAYNSGWDVGNGRNIMWRKLTCLLNL
jgi:hypothetical protein